MAVQKQTGAGNFSTQNFTYSSFVALILKREEKEAYDAALQAAGITEAEVKKGYGTPASIKARTALKAADITGYKLSGHLGYLAVREKNLGNEQKPNNQKFLVVGLNDGQETMYLEIPAAHDVAGALARKLVNVEPGAEVTISLFATVGDAGYANHAASVKSNGAEVKCISYKEGPSVIVDAKLSALKAAGINDKEILAKTRRSAIGEYNESIVNATANKFEAYRATNKTAPAPADATPASAPQDNGFNGDDVPF